MEFYETPQCYVYICGSAVIMWPKMCTPFWSILVWWAFMTAPVLRLYLWQWPFRILRIRGSAEPSMMLCSLHAQHGHHQYLSEILRGNFFFFNSVPSFLVPGCHRTQKYLWAIYFEFRNQEAKTRPEDTLRNHQFQMSCLMWSGSKYDSWLNCVFR